eukprot:scaffold1243_cov403-Prasinococcus_capsulatus_cf.AAC.3
MAFASFDVDILDLVPNARNQLVQVIGSCVNLRNNLLQDNVVLKKHSTQFSKVWCSLSTFAIAHPILSLLSRELCPRCVEVGTNH